MAEKGLKITDEFLDEFIKACQTANQTQNSRRNGRKFKFIERIDEYSIKVLLESYTSVIPTRAISSITRALLRSEMAEELQKHQYKGSIIIATTLDNENEMSFSNLDDYEIVQSVIEIFFGTFSYNKDKEVAKNSAKQIRDVVISFKNQLKP